MQFAQPGVPEELLPAPSAASAEPVAYDPAELVVSERAPVRDAVPYHPPLPMGTMILDYTQADLDSIAAQADVPAAAPGSDALMPSNGQRPPTGNALPGVVAHGGGDCSDGAASNEMAVCTEEEGVEEDEEWRSSSLEELLMLASERLAPIDPADLLALGRDGGLDGGLDAACRHVRALLCTLASVLHIRSCYRDLGAEKLIQYGTGLYGPYLYAAKRITKCCGDTT